MEISLALITDRSYAVSREAINTMKARFEVWRVLGDSKAYYGLPYGVRGVGICVSRKFSPNHFGRIVRVAILPFKEW